MMSAAAGFSLAAAPAAAEQHAATSPAPRWASHAVATPQGGWRMGNPDAAVRLVEYASVSCSHCAHFSREAAAPLRALVDAGRVNFELRPVMLFPADPGLFRLMQCAGPERAFAIAERLFATQDEWTARIDGKNEPAGMEATVRAAGLEAMLRDHGLVQASVDACLADRAATEGFLDTTRRAADADRVDGTPTFFINGRMVDATEWQSDIPGRGIEPLLQAALGVNR